MTPQQQAVFWVERWLSKAEKAMALPDDDPWKWTCVGFTTQRLTDSLKTLRKLEDA
jgi:hypothetical protein